MGFLQRLFGGKKNKKPYVDTRGIYFYAQCDRCGSVVRLRADKEYDLNRESGGFVWHKTIVDNRCFRPMPAVVHLDTGYKVTQQTIENGRFITQEAYEAAQQPAGEPE